MRKVGFVVDSTFGDQFANIAFVPLTITVEGKEYVDGKLSPEIVVKALGNKQQIITSQPTPGAFVEAYQNQFDLGYDHVICLTVSKSLSGTYNSALLAKEMLENDNVTVIDTGTISVGARYILEKAFEYAEAGNDFLSTVSLIEKLIKEGSIIFSVDELGTLVRGGRLSRTAALIGNVLRVKPILRFKQGELEVEAKVRRFSGVVKYIIDQVLQLVDKLKVVVRITYVDNYEYAKAMEDSILALKEDKIDVKIAGVLSPIISAHVGLGGMGIYLTTE